MRRTKAVLFLTLSIIAISLFSLNMSLVIAEYTYVNLSILAMYEEDFFGVPIMTSGVVRLDIVSIPETSANVFLSDLDSSHILGVNIRPLTQLPHGSNIIVQGYVGFDPWGGYCFFVQFWEFGSFSWWNIADINQDQKVDMDDVLLCVNAYYSTPPDPNWNPICDLTVPYGIINLYDIVLIGRSYGDAHSPKI